MITAIVSAVVAANFDALQSWWSSREPIAVQSLGPGRYNPVAFTMVVPVGRLPESVFQLNDCQALYQAGMQAGGNTAVGSDIERIVLTGKAKDSVTIVGMQAVVTKHEPAHDGTYLSCPTQGEIDSTGIKFDLKKTDTANATFIDKDSGKTQDRFATGSVINLADNEAFPMEVTSDLPDDAVHWHIEARLLGQSNPVIIDNNGHDFVTVGQRRRDSYERGYSQYDELPAPTFRQWGVADASVSGTDTDARLSADGVVIPYRPGTDFYQAHKDTDGAPRMIRQNSQPLITFDNTALVSFPPPSAPIDTLCDRDPGSRLHYDFGYIRAITAVDAGSTTQRGVPLVHRSEDVRCSLGGNGDRNNKDGAKSSDPTDPFWHCGSTLCPEVVQRLEWWSTALPTGQPDPAGTTFWMWYDGLTPAQIAAAQSIMSGATVNPNQAAPVQQGAIKPFVGDWSQHAGDLNVSPDGSVALTYQVGAVSGPPAFPRLGLRVVAVSGSSAAATVTTSEDPAAPIGSVFKLVLDGSTGITLFHPNGRVDHWCDPNNRAQGLCGA